MITTNVETAPARADERFNLMRLSDRELCTAGLPGDVVGREILRRAFQQAVSEVVAEYGDVLMLGASR